MVSIRFLAAAVLVTTLALPVQPVQALICIGGGNAGATCTVASQCPGGYCAASTVVDWFTGFDTCEDTFALPFFWDAVVPYQCVAGTNAGFACTLTSQCPGSNCAGHCNSDDLCFTAADCQSGPCVTNIPVMVADTSPGAGNRCAQQFNPGTGKVGSWVAKNFTASSQESVGVEFKLTSGPEVDANRRPLAQLVNTALVCLGGTNAGATCTVASQCPSGSCGNRRGVILALSSPVSSGLRVGQLSVLYGSTDHGQTCQTPPCDGFAGRCDASLSMNDTPCGGKCLVAADCMQGRTTEQNIGFQTDCVDDVATVACPTGLCPAPCGGTVCHCINECDVHFQGESKCSPGIIGSVGGITVNSDYIAVVDQANGNASNPGLVTVSFYWGPYQAGLPVVFQRRVQTTKQGTCGGGTDLGVMLDAADGRSIGRNRAACGNNADCACVPSGGGCTDGTCDTSNVVQVNRVVLGPDDGFTATQSCGFGSQEHTCSSGLVASIGAAFVSHGDTPYNFRVEQVLAKANGPTQEWDSSGCLTCAAGTNAGGNCLNNSACPGSVCNVETQYFCLLGNGAPTTEPDGYTSWIGNFSNGASVNEDIKFLGPAETTDTWRGVVAEILAQDSESSFTHGIGLTPEFHKSTDNSWIATGTGLDLNSFSPDDGTGSHYHLIPQMFSNNGALFAGMENISLRFIRSAPNAGGDIGRVTFAGVSHYLEMPNPTAVPVIADTDGDGQRTAAFAGDSTWNERLLASQLVTRVASTDLQNVIEWTRGGLAQGDVEAGFTSFLNGQTYAGSVVTAQAVLGQSNKKVDVGVIQILVNTAHLIGVADPALPISSEGIAQAGWCEQWGVGVGYGPREGLACYCPVNTNFALPVYWGGYCTLKNTQFGGSCNNSLKGCTVKRCVVGTDAGLPCGSLGETTCPGSSCSTKICVGGTNAGAACATATSECPGGGACSLNNVACAFGQQAAGSALQSGLCNTLQTACQVNAAAVFRADNIPCYAGCLNAPGCPSEDGRSGICISGNSLARIRRGTRDMQATADSVSQCVGGTNNNASCTVATMCPGGTCTPWHPKLVWGIAPPPSAGAPYCFVQEKPVHDAFRDGMLADLKLTGGNFIDTYGYFLRDCPDHDWAQCLREGLHYTDLGNQISGNAIGDCLTNSSEAYGTAAGSSVTDGICNLSPTCSGGKCDVGLRAGEICTQCVGGTNARGACTVASECPGGSCSPLNSLCAYCSQGKVGDHCDANRDCGYYYCDLS